MGLLSGFGFQVGFVENYGLIFSWPIGKVGLEIFGKLNIYDYFLGMTFLKEQMEQIFILPQSVLFPGSVFLWSLIKAAR